MGKGSRTSSHQMFKDKAKNRVDDLQGMFSYLQFARWESRTGDVVVLEEQVHQMLREWKAELNEASPASSLHGPSRVSSDLSLEIRRLLQLCEEEDDATSKLAELPLSLKPEPDGVAAAALRKNVHNHHGEQQVIYHEGYYTNQILPEHEFRGIDGIKNASHMESHHVGVDCLDVAIHLDFQQYNMHQQLPNDMFPHFDVGVPHGTHEGCVAANLSDLLPTIAPPASAFLRPKCALWDCPRPAKGGDCYADYCCSGHGILASSEGHHDMMPVLRPGGIDLKDGPLFAALTAKNQGKNVGIPECQGAATAKSPWNAPELFDLSVLEGESIREWLFFDKPRRAFESGNRKQRSLPDYTGRGWHESRKQVMMEYGGLKRSYYMDPQPLNHFEWHLYEYEINDCDDCALYRLELKLVDPKKSAKGKVSGSSLTELQQQMVKLNNSDSLVENEISGKSRTKVNQKDSPSPSPGNLRPDFEVALGHEAFYGPSLPYGYSVESMNHYYGT